MKKGITKVPNGPLIKKKGPYAGSTLRSGGKIKKAMNGTTTTQTTTPVKKTWQQMTQAERAAIKTNLGPEKFKKYKDSVSADASNRANAMFERNAATRGMTVEELRKSNAKDEKKPNAALPGLLTDEACKRGKTTGSCATGQSNRGESLRDTKKNGGKVMKNGGPLKKAMIGTGIFKNNPITKKANTARGLVGKAYGLPGGVIAKNGEMIKRADGSYSRRGLWDNIRANKGSGKKPTKQMLQQERKIKAKSKK